MLRYYKTKLLYEVLHYLQHHMRQGIERWKQIIWKRRNRKAFILFYTSEKLAATDTAV